MQYIIRRGVVCEDETLFGYCGWPSVGLLPGGRLAAVFSGNRLKHVCPFGRTVVCYSSDEGKTWTAPSAVINTAFDDRDGGIAVKGEQVLVTAFNNNFAFQLAEAEHNNDKYTPIIKEYIALNADADEDFVGSCIAVSEDGGKTFGKPYLVPVTAPHGPIVLSDGRYFYVGRSFSIAEKFRTKGRKYDFLPEGIWCMFSANGYDWSEPQPVYTPKEGDYDLYCEPHAIQKNNGEVIVQIRVQNTKGKWGALRTYQTESHGGITGWSEPHDLGIMGSPPHLMRHSSGKLVCVTGRREVPYAEQAMISSDDGKTWSAPFAIDDNVATDDMGYPCSVELSDGSILTVYYQKKTAQSKAGIYYTVWKIPETL